MQFRLKFAYILKQKKNIVTVIQMRNIRESSHTTGHVKASEWPEPYVYKISQFLGVSRGITVQCHDLFGECKLICRMVWYPLTSEAVCDETSLSQFKILPNYANHLKKKNQKNNHCCLAKPDRRLTVFSRPKQHKMGN